MLDFQTALSGKREVSGRLSASDPLIHRNVASAINGLTDLLAPEKKRVPGEILCEAQRLECLLFNGYDPQFEGDEPPEL